MEKYYKIADTVLRIESPYIVQSEALYRQFQVAPQKPDYEVIFQEIQKVPSEILGASPIAEERHFQIVEKDHKEYRLFYKRGVCWGYGEEKGSCMYLYVCNREQLQRLIHTQRQELNYIPLEKILARKGAYILHCAYVEHHGQAVLLAGASGVGKSTQAALWEQYENARIINGDRAVLKKENAGYRAYGLPISGSSGVSLPEAYAVKAIIFLRQGNSCNIRRLQGSEAVTNLCLQITGNRWNKKMMEEILDFSIDMSKNLPLYEEVCTLEKETVDTAMKEIK